VSSELGLSHARNATVNRARIAVMFRNPHRQQTRVDNDNESRSGDAFDNRHACAAADSRNQTIRPAVFAAGLIHLPKIYVIAFAV
jgi:hypothetical protein